MKIFPPHPLTETLPSLKAVIETYQLYTKKSLGQHFLLDTIILRKIVQCAALDRQSVVIEIGPGPGGLTRALLETPAAKIIVIEKDNRCIQALNFLQQYSDFQIVHDDALQIDLQQFYVPSAKFFIIANLPYNISVPLLLKWLELRTFLHQMILMFQKEVALRLCAVPGTKDYGRLSVISQWHCQIDYQFDIKPGTFYPPPQVMSSVVKLTPKVITDYSIRPFLEKITFAAFNQRRKMLRVSLQQLGDLGMQALEFARIPPTARPEELTIEEFVSLSQAYQNLCT